MTALPAFASLSDLIIQHATVRPGQEAMVSEGRRWHFEALLRGIKKAAQLFSEGGVAPGDRVLLMSPTCDTFVVAFLALAWLGAIPVPINPNLLEVEVIALARACRARLMLADASIGDMVRSAFLRACEGRVIRMDPRRQQISYQDVEGEGPPINYHDLPFDAAPEPHPASGSTPLTVLFAPGKLGQARGVLLTHQSVLAIAAAAADSLPLASYPKVAITLPLQHAFPLVSQLLATLYVGGAVHLFRNLAFPYPVLQAMQLEGVQGYAGVPATFRLLASLDGLDELDLGTVRHVSTGGARLGPAEVACVRRVFPRAEIHHGYGLTEAAGRVTVLAERDPHFLTGSAGLPLPGVELQVRQDGQCLGPGEEGEIWVRGPGLMTGYWQDPHATQRTLHAGWLRTPDRGHLDAGGYLFLSHREDGLFTVGEEKVAPAEVEEVLRRHRSVMEAAVTGLPDPILGDRLVACVTPARGGVDALGLLRHCDRHLARHKCPQEVQVFAELPRTADGVFDRHALRAACLARAMEV